MRYFLYTYGILFFGLSSCQPSSVDTEKNKLSVLEQKIIEQSDSLNIVSTKQLLELQDSIKALSKRFQPNQQDSIAIVFTSQMVRNFEHMALRLEYFRNYRDSLQYDLEFSNQQLTHLKNDLEKRIWDKEQFHIFYVQETKSIHKNGKRIEENNKLIREELETYFEYEKKIRAVINDQQNRLSSTNEKILK